MRAVAVGFFALAIASGIAVACKTTTIDASNNVEEAGAVPPPPPDGQDSATPDGGAASAFTLATPKGVSVVRGTSASLEIDVTRAAFTKDITLTLSGLPAGTATTGASVVLSAGQTHATFSLVAAPSSGLGPVVPEVTASAVGETSQVRTFDLLVADPPGTLDLTFGGAGVVSVAGGAAEAAAIDPAGEVVVGGFVGGSARLERYGRTGVPDTSFNTAVVSPLAVSAQAVTIRGVASRVITVTNPQVVVVGTNTDNRWFVSVFNHDGTPDTTFGVQGTLRSNSSTATSEARAVAVDSKQRIVWVGRDTSKGGAGGGGRIAPGAAMQNLQYPARPAPYDGSSYFPAAMTLGDADDVWIAGTLRGAAIAPFLVHLDANLQPDSSFGTGGLLLVGENPSSEGRAVSRFPGDGGAVLVAGLGGSTGVREMFGIFLPPSGQAIFDGGTETVAHSQTGFGYHAAAIERDGRMLLAGGAGTPTSERPFYERRFADGGLSPATDGGTAADGGTVEYFTGAKQSQSEWRAAAIAKDGRIVVAGFDTSGWLVARYWP